MAKLTTNYGSIRQLITGDSKYVVPPYQRRFRWRRKGELQDLWEDVLARYGTGRDTHFLGAVVVGEGKPPDPLGVTEFVIIDGQQRLISLTLLIAALRDVLVASAEQAEEIQRKYLIHATAKGQLAHLRVEPGKADLAVYKECMLGTSVGRSPSPIAAAYRFFKKRLSDGFTETDLTGREESDADEQPAPETDSATEVGDDDDLRTAETKPFDWERLLVAVLDQLEIVTISDVTSENAYEVFRTLNSTGLQLDQVDLLRNAFFYLLPGRGAQIHEDVWVPMEERLGSELEAFFHTELLRRGENIPRRETYRTFMRLIRSDSEEDAIAELLRRLNDRASIYAAIRLLESPLPVLGDKRFAKDHLESLERLRRWGAGPTYPLVLESAIRWRDGALSSDDFARVLGWVESLLVRRFIVGIPPNDMRSVFARLMTQLQQAFRNRQPDSKTFITEVQRALMEPVRRWPSDQEIKKATREQPLYRANKAKECFFVLRGLAERIEGKECPQIILGTESGKYSIEHVLPQTLTQQWEADLRSWDGEPQQVWEERRDVIGNLTLTAYNSELGQKPFSAKRAFIKENLYLKLSKKIADSRQWSRNEIDERSAELGRLACQIWPRPADE